MKIEFSSIVLSKDNTRTGDNDNIRKIFMLLELEYLKKKKKQKKKKEIIEKGTYCPKTKFGTSWAHLERMKGDDNNEETGDD